MCINFIINHVFSYMVGSDPIEVKFKYVDGVDEIQFQWFGSSAGGFHVKFHTSHSRRRRTHGLGQLAQR